jgi:hypothetical protein
LVAASLRGNLELGLVMHVSAGAPAGVKTLPLIPLRLPAYEGWGACLSDVAELAIAMPDEVASYLLFDGAAKTLRLSLELQDNGTSDPATAMLLARLAPLAGRLSGGARKALLKAVPLAELARLSSVGQISLRLDFAHDPAQVARRAQWAASYLLSAEQAAAAGLSPERAYKGSYLAGLASVPDFKELKKSRTADIPGTLEAGAGEPVAFDALAIDDNWDLCQRWPALLGLKLARRQCDWPVCMRLLQHHLRWCHTAGEKVLLILPQTWMLDRLWPALAELQGSLLRWYSSYGNQSAAHLLRELGKPLACVIAGGPAAWRFAAFERFDRIVIVDPNHPGYEPQGEPWLDPRSALLLCAARHSAPGRETQIDLFELGLGMTDGANRLAEVAIMPGSVEDAALEAVAALPAPRLVYLNRLGSRRGLSCAECQAAVPCPNCGSNQIYYSAAGQAYHCPNCDFSSSDVRCRRCGLMTLSASSIGLEAFALEPGDLRVSAESEALPGPVSPTASVYGTARLLEPLPGVCPGSIAYLHSDGKRGAVDDWPRALDMLARLAALYPGNGHQELLAYGLLEEFPERMTGHELAQRLQLELRLRRLGQLPPFGCLYQLHLRADDPAGLKAARELLGQALQPDASTQLLRLGQPYPAAGARGYRLGGFFINPRLGQAELQELRRQVRESGASLQLQALRGPWL